MTSGIHDTGQITRTPGTETAVLAGGCFWGMEDLIRRQPGVLQTRVGYTGGQNSHATYRIVIPATPRRWRSSSTPPRPRTVTSWRSSSRSTTRRP
jgi:hypothetical protein